MPNWLLISLAAVTFLNRYAFLATSVRYTPGPRVRRFLSYSSYAVLTAIWVPLVFTADPNAGWVDLTGFDYLFAALLAAGLTMAGVRSLIVVLASKACFFWLRFVVLV